MLGFEQFLEVLTLLAFVSLGALTFVLWRRRRDNTSYWMALTFGDLAVVVVANRILDQFEQPHSALVDYAQTLVVAIVVLFPYFLYRVAYSFASGSRIMHLVAAIPTAVVFVWAVLAPRFPEEGEPRPGWYQAFVLAVLFQWVLCSFLVAGRFWHAGTGQPPVTRKRMRTMAVAATALSVGIVIVGVSGGSRAAAVGIAVQLFALGSTIAFYFAFAPPAWLRAAWRRESEDKLRRGVIELMGAVTDEAVVEVLLPHAATLIGAEAIAMCDTGGRVVGSFGGDETEWQEIASATDEVLEQDCVQKLEFPFGCLLVKTTPYTLFFGRDEIELLGALGVMTNLALERVRASEMRLELAETHIRRQQALQINDNVVQGLAVAKYAFDLGHNEKAKEAIEGTLAAARRIISDLLEEASDQGSFDETALTRDAPATGFVKKDI